MLTRFRDFPLSPFDLLAREMDRAFAEVDRHGLLAVRGEADGPRVNVYEDDKGFLLHAEVPGARDEDVQLTVEDDVVTLRFERKVEVPEGYATRVKERAQLSFERKLSLGARIDAEAVTATLKDGVLTVTLPKAREALRRQIAVRAS
jgi:HSP20 family protein